MLFKLAPGLGVNYVWSIALLPTPTYFPVWPAPFIIGLTRPVTESRLDVRNAFDSTLVDTLSVATVADVDEAVARGKKLLQNSLFLCMNVSAHCMPLQTIWKIMRQKWHFC